MNRGCLVALIVAQTIVAAILLVALFAQVSIIYFQHTHPHPACYEVSDPRCWADAPQENP